MKFIRGHYRSGLLKVPDDVLFWRSVDKSAGPNACWPWVGGKHEAGYGVAHLNRKPVLAHRVAYMLTHGEIPSGLFICHRCDNRPCCNPAHLFAGTQAENIADMISKGRNPTGELHKSSKLSNASVAAIRALQGQGWTQRRIANAFGVSRGHIGLILQGKTRAKG